MDGVRYGAGTDVGLARDHNEDAYLVNDELGLWVVADGMGGHEAGEVASAIAVQTVNAAVARGQTLDTALSLAHRAILKGGQKGGPGAAGMGCTCVAARLEKDQYEVAWVGDSRAYLWKDGGLQQLSHDHSYVQTLVDLGVINEHEAIDHPDRSVLTQCLGSRTVDQLEVGTQAGALGPGESLLLCSDGLTGEVKDARIAEILADSPDEQVAVDRLIIAALENGGSDNVTVVVVSVEPGVAGGGDEPTPTRERKAPARGKKAPAAAPAAAGENRNDVRSGTDGPAGPDPGKPAERRVRDPAAAAALARSAGRGGAAAAPMLPQTLLQERRERARRAGAPSSRPVARRPRKHWLVRLMLVRIAPSEIGPILARQGRRLRRALAQRLAPVQRRFTLIGMYARRAVLALGVAMVAVGAGGGLYHGW